MQDAASPRGHLGAGAGGAVKMFPEPNMRTGATFSSSFDYKVFTVIVISIEALSPRQASKLMQIMVDVHWWLKVE